MGYVIGFLMVCLPCGFIAASIARAKARRGARWFWAGLIFGPLGLIGAAGMPDRKSQAWLRYLAEAQGYQPRHQKESEVPE